MNLAWWKSLSDFDGRSSSARGRCRGTTCAGSSATTAKTRFDVAETQYKNKIERQIDIAAFQKAVQPVYDKYLKQIPNGESIVKQIREMK